MPRAQRESGHKVKVIRTDNGGEFIGADFEAVLKKKGIQHQLTVPYNPQQNGVAERFNRTLQEGAHTLLGRAGLPDPFWVTALRQVALELCMLQLEGLDDGSGRVRKLKKAIYGLKQAPRAWYHKVEETLLAGGFKKSECDHSLFLLQEKEQFLILLVYVDDTLLFSESAAMIERVEEMLEMQFKCSKMGDVKYYLGMHVERDLDKGVLRLHQKKYCEGLAEKYGLQDGGKPATPLPSGFTVEPFADEVVGESDRKLFHSMVGALNYAANHKRPDIAFATSRLASVVSRPSQEQLEAAKRLVRYVSATTSVGFEYSAVRQRQQRGAADFGQGEMLLNCYTDASFNSVKADGISIGGYVCLFGGGLVSWRSKKQNEVGLSLFETEYMALHHGVKEVVWLRRLLEEIGVSDPSLFLRTDTLLPPFYILVYVDDLVFSTTDTAGLAHVKSELQKRHTCTDLGELCSYLGLQITRDRARCTITLTQSHMVQQVLQRFDFMYSSPQATPLSTRHSLSALPSDESVEPSGLYPELVGCLMYLMTCTRPDLAYPLSILARYVAPGRHRPEHMAAAKRVLRYLCSTSGLGLVLGGRSPVVHTGHADASWVDDQATQRSSQGYTFSVGSGSVSWRSTRSSFVLSSSCEAEIYAGAIAAQELRWLTYLLTDLGEPPHSPPVLYVDNKAMLALCREHRLEHRTKHIALRYFLARELQQRGQLRLAYLASQANTADIFTKALQPCDHQRFCTMLGDRAGQTCRKPHTQHRCFSRLDDAWRVKFGDEAKRPRGAELLRSGVANFDIDYAMSVSAEGDCYLCVPPDLGIEAAALGASESPLRGTAQAEALHTFTLDSGASRCFFHDSTTLTPLSAPVPVRLADPSGGPVLACSSTVLSCPAVLSSSLSVPPLPPSPAPLCLPCIEGRQRAAPHSSSFPLTTASLQTLHMACGAQPASVDRATSATFCCHGVRLYLHDPCGSSLFSVHHLNLWPHNSLPESSPTQHWTGEVSDASVFQVWGSRAFVRDTSADKLSARAIPCVFLGFPPDASGWQSYHPTLRRVFPSQDVTFDESVPFCRLFPHRSAPPPPPPLFLAPGPPPVDPLPPKGPAPSGVSQVDPLPGTVPVEVAVESRAARGAVSGGAEPGGAKSEGDKPGVAEPAGVEPGGAEL
ncbi:unnamed protein product [Closterium sp. NIES-54]